MSSEQVPVLEHPAETRRSENVAPWDVAAAPKTKGVGGRLKAAAERLRGGGKKDDEGAKPSTKPTKGGGRKATTPRKVGGS